MSIRVLVADDQSMVRAGFRVERLFPRYSRRLAGCSLSIEEARLQGLFKRAMGLEPTTLRLGNRPRDAWLMS